MPNETGFLIANLIILGMGLAVLALTYSALNTLRSYLDDIKKLHSEGATNARR